MSYSNNLQLTNTESIQSHAHADFEKKGKSQSKILSKKGHMTDFAGSWLTKSFKIAEKVALNPVSNRINFEFGFLNPVIIPVFYLPAPAGIRWFFQILI